MQDVIKGGIPCEFLDLDTAARESASYAEIGSIRMWTSGSRNSARGSRVVCAWSVLRASYGITLWKPWEKMGLCVIEIYSALH